MVRRIIIVLFLVATFSVMVYAFLDLFVLEDSITKVSHGLKVKIEDEEERPLYVFLVASMVDAKGEEREMRACSKGYIIDPSKERVGYDGSAYPYVFCGERPGFSRLKLVIMLWELSSLNDEREDVDKAIERHPDFHAVVQRPDFDYSTTKDYMYVPFATIGRRKGCKFEMLPPESPGYAPRPHQATGKTGT